MARSPLNPALLRSRWAAIGAAIAVSVGAGGLAIANAAVSSDAAVFHAQSPVRVFDTREGSGGVPVGPIGAGASLDVVVGGTNGVPIDATAVVLNVTVVGGTTSSFLTVWPTGDTKPTASALNWTNANATPNGVTVPLGTAGKVSFFNFAGTVHVLADVVGYYTAAANTPPFTPVVAQSVASGALGAPQAPAVITSVALTLPDVCPGAQDQWKVLVHADGYFLTGGTTTSGDSATVGLSLDGTTFQTGGLVAQNFQATGQYRAGYSTTYLFTVDAGTRAFYEIGQTNAGVGLGQNNLIAQSVSVSC